MTNPRKATGQTTRLQMTRLLSNSGATSLTPSSRGDVSRARKTQSQRTSQNRQRDPSLEAVAAPGRPCGKCRRNRGRNKSLQAGFTPYTVLPGSYHSTRCKPLRPYDDFGIVTRGRWILPYRILRRGRRHSMLVGQPENKRKGRHLVVTSPRVCLKLSGISPLACLIFIDARLGIPLALQETCRHWAGFCRPG